MNLPHFKEYLSNTVACILFNYLDPYKDNLHSTNAFFDVPPLNTQTRTKEESRLSLQDRIQQKSFIHSLNQSPEEDKVMNNDFNFIMKFDSISFKNGISLQDLNQISQKFHTDSLFVNGDGNDFQISEYYSGHESLIILQIQFKGNKNDLINDYKQWYSNRESLKSAKKHKNKKVI